MIPLFGGDSKFSLFALSKKKKRATLNMSADVSDHLPQQLQPRKATESSFLCSTALVRDAMEQVVYNLMMLKTRVLHRVDVPLQQWEVDMMLDNQHNYEKDVTDYAKMPDTVRHVVDQELTLVDSSVKLPHNAAAKALREQIDGFFRFTFEEVALRWESEGVTRKEKEAPRTTLFKAVDYQRGHIDDLQAKNAALSKQVDLLKTQCAQLTQSLANKDAIHKKETDSFLREVCILKEQLYRSYRNKDYVGKDVDMLNCIVDDDTGEDVSVDELLRARRMMRGIESQMQILREQIGALTAELTAKGEIIHRLQEKTRSQESTIYSQRSELDQLNSMTLTLENENKTLADELDKVRLDLHHARKKKTATNGAKQPIEDSREAEDVVEEYRDVEIQTEREKIDTPPPPPQPEVITVTLKDPLREAYDAEELQLASEFKGKTRLELTAIIEECKKAQKCLSSEYENKALQYEALSAMNKQLTAENEEQKSRFATLAKDTEDMKKENERLANDLQKASETAANAIVAVDKDLREAHDATFALRRQNAALCQAYVNISERLEQIKTRAGLIGYKQRSNDFHFKRAETAIRDANNKAEQIQKQCEEKLGALEAEVDHVHDMLRFALEDIDACTRQHKEEIGFLTERTTAVKTAFESLLQDFHHLREEYVGIALKSNPHHTEDIVKQSMENPTCGPQRQRFVFEEVNKAVGQEKLLATAMRLLDPSFQLVSSQTPLLATTTSTFAQASGFFRYFLEMLDGVLQADQAVKTRLAKKLATAEAPNADVGPVRSRETLNRDDAAEQVAMEQQHNALGWDRLRAFVGLEEKARDFVDALRKDLKSSELVGLGNAPPREQLSICLTSSQVTPEREEPSPKSESTKQQKKSHSPQVQSQENKSQQPLLLVVSDNQAAPSRRFSASDKHTRHPPPPRWGAGPPRSRVGLPDVKNLRRAVHDSGSSPSSSLHQPHYFNDASDPNFVPLPSAAVGDGQFFDHNEIEMHYRELAKRLESIEEAPPHDFADPPWKKHKKKCTCTAEEQ